MDKRTTNSVTSKIMSLVLTVAMIIGMVPTAIATAFAADDSFSHKVTAYTGSLTQNGSEYTFGNLELEYAPVDSGIGRNTPGWWAGLKVAAPMYDEAVLANATYKINGSAEANFWNDRNSTAGKDADGRHYIDIWVLLNEERLSNAKYNNTKIVYDCTFDWDGAGSLEASQVKMVIDPVKVKLTKGGAEVYPAGTSGKVVPFGADLTADKAETGYVVVSYKNKASLSYIEGNGTNPPYGSWWAGFKVIAPDYADAAKVKYQSKTNTGWSEGKSLAADGKTDGKDHYEFWAHTDPAALINAQAGKTDVDFAWRIDWDGDGVYEQLINLKFSPDKLTLLDADDKKVYPKFGTIAPITGTNAPVENDGNYTLTIDDASLQWYPANAAIGRMEEGWWAGALITAPENFNVEKLKTAKLNKAAYSLELGAYGEYGADIFFWDNRDSKHLPEDSSVQYIQVWLRLDPSIVADYAGKANVGAMYRFDWDGDGAFDQTFTFEVDPEKVTLIKLDQTGAKFMYEGAELADITVEDTLFNVFTTEQNAGTVTYEISKITANGAPVDAASFADYAAVSADGTVSFKLPCTVEVKAKISGDAKYNAAEKTYSITAVKADQDGAKLNISGEEQETVYNAADSTYANPVIGTVPENATVEYSVEVLEGNVTVSIDANGTLTYDKAGVVKVTATVIETATHNAVTFTYTLTIKKAEQDTPVVFGDIAGNPVLTYAPDAIVLDGWANGGNGSGAYVFGIGAGNDVAEITEDGKLKLNKSGKFTLTVYKAEDDCYNQSAVASLEITVNRAEQSGFAFAETEQKYTYNDVSGNVISALVPTGGQSDGAVEYSIENAGTQTVDSIATIDAAGNITAVGAGEVTVIATKLANDKYNATTAKYKLTVALCEEPKLEAENVTVVFGTEAGAINVTKYSDDDGIVTFALAEGSEDKGISIDADTGAISYDDNSVKDKSVKVIITKEAGSRYVACSTTALVKIATNAATEEQKNGIQITGEKKTNENWYTGDVTLTAPEGYLISKTDDIDGVWSDKIVYTEDNRGINGTKEIYASLKNIETGAITKAVSFTEVRIDKTAPEALSIKYENAGWWSTAASIADSIFFGYVNTTTENTPAKITFTATETTSGFDKFVINIAGVVIPVDADKLTIDETGKATYTHIHDTECRGKVSFSVFDKAGNETTLVYKNEEGKYNELVVDYTSPELEVAFGYEGTSDKYGDAFVTDKKTTVNFAITEANFDLLFAKNKLPSLKVWKDGLEYSVTLSNWEQDESDLKWKASFELEEEGDYNIRLIYNDLSHKEKQTYEQELHIDATAPVITVEYPTDDAQNETFYKADKTVTIKVDEHHFVAENTSIVITATDVKGNPVEITEDYDAFLKNPDNWTTDETDNDIHYAEITFSADANYYVEYYNCDILGNNAGATIDEALTVDHVAPENYTFEYVETEAHKTFLESVTLGFFHIYSDKATVKVTVDDITAGVDFIELEFVADELVNYTGESYKLFENKDITFENDGLTAVVVWENIPAQARGRIKATATDKAGNDSSVTDDDVVIADTEESIITVDFKSTMAGYENGFRAEGNNRYTNDAVTATITIKEPNFFDGQTFMVDGVETVIHNAIIKLKKVDENGNETVREYLPADLTWVKDNDTNTCQIMFTEEGDYTLEVEYTDHSGNVAEKYTSAPVIYTIDKTAPKVNAPEYVDTPSSKTIDGRDYIKGSSNVKAEDGYRTVTITVIEHNFDKDGLTHAVLQTLYNTNAITEEKYEILNGGWQEIGKDTYQITIKYTGDANYTVHYEITDYANNNTATEELKFTVDNTAPKAEAITYSQPVISKIFQGITFGFYKAPVTVTITASDDVSGVNKFDYTYNRANNVSGTNTATLTGTIEAEYTNGMFVGQFTIPAGDAQLNGHITFRAYDRSENFAAGTSDYTDKNDRIIRDTISPKVEVTYNQPANAASDDVHYYAGDIDVAIKITEANFYSDQVVVSVTKDGVDYPVKVNWTDNTFDLHTGTFTLKYDGDYNITVAYTDYSGNVMPTYTSRKLVLDTTKPTVVVSDIKANSANKDKPYSFTVTAEDINIDQNTFMPTLKGIVRNDDGKYEEKTVAFGAITVVTEGKSYAYTMSDVELDGVYTLTCSVKDMSGNVYDKVLLASDNTEYGEVKFSVNRDGSVFLVDDDYTSKVLNKYYVTAVNNVIVITEINTDLIETYTVKLNGKALNEGADYTTQTPETTGEWAVRKYIINKDHFTSDGEYNIVIESTDKTGTDAYSDVKGCKVAFVVDSVAPVITVSGIKEGGRYQVETQTVTAIVTDDGGKLSKVTVKLNGKVHKTWEGDELLNMLEESGGILTFDIPSGLEHDVEIIAEDCAKSLDESVISNSKSETFSRVTVSTNMWLQFYANKPLFYGTIAGVVLLIGAAVFFVVKKKSKKETAEG